MIDVRFWLRIPAICAAIVASISLISAVGIARFAPYMAPVREGNSHAFWMAATGVKLSDDVRDRQGDTYFVDDEWAAYDLQHLHGSDIYRVPKAQILADFDAVIAALEKTAQSGETNFVTTGYVSWRDDLKLPRTAYALHSSIKKARLRDRIERDPMQAYSLAAGEQIFWHRWDRVPWYWANYAFEWTFLTGLTLFLFWPGIHSLSIWRWALHVAFAPLFFIAPVYLGYASFSLTSAGPSGGILYPFLVISLCRGGFVTDLDRWILRRLPTILEPISTSIGEPMALTGMGGFGPTQAILTGLGGGATLLAVSWGYNQWKKRLVPAKPETHAP
jgi:hypothetical protein